MLRHLGRLARRYRVRPSSLLQGSALDLGIDVLCAAESDIESAEALERAGGFVFPVFVVGES